VVRTYLAWVLAAAAAGALLAVLWPVRAGSPEERRAIEAGRVVITYWDRHSGHEHEARVRLFDEYNRTQGVVDGVYVRALPIGYNMEKMLTAIAGSAPPDLCSLEGTVLVALAPQGCFLPIGDRMAASPHLREEAFFPHTWKAVSYDGRVYGVPTTCDTMCLLWNKSAFRRAGLDPERPPQTIAELEEYAGRLTIHSETGFDQIGFLPWLPWDLSHMWGGLFGGVWFDDASGRAVNGADPRIIASLEWQRSFSVDPRRSDNPPHAMDPARIAAFRSGFGAYMSANTPFYSGKVAMITEGEWQVTFIPKYAPDLDWGVAPIPQPEGAPPRCYSTSCVADAIPANCRHPEEAWKVIEWLYAPRPGTTRSPASDYAREISNIPCRRAEALDERFMGDPKFRVFVEELLNKPAVSYPVTPAAQVMLDEIERQREYVVFHQTTPEAASQTIERTANAEIERIEGLLEQVRP